MLNTAHRYFLQVVQTGSVKDAAAQLHVAASAVSRQIAKLEELSGAPLFERRPHGMVPTEAGELIARYARRTAMDAQRMQQEVRMLSKSALRISIRIGSSEAVALSLLPQAMTAFRAVHPDVAFHVQIATPAAVAQRLADGSIDIGLAFSLRQAASNSPVLVRHQAAAPLRVVMAPGHPLARRERLTLNDLRPYPLALTDLGTTARLVFDSIASEGEGPHFDVAYASSSSSLVFALVKTRQAITLAGDIALREALLRGELVAVPLAESGVESRVLQIQTARDRALPAEIEQFLASLTETLEASQKRPAARRSARNAA